MPPSEPKPRFKGQIQAKLGFSTSTQRRALINTVALARCRDALSIRKLFQQFLDRGMKAWERRRLAGVLRFFE